MLACLLVKTNSAYMKAIHTSVYIQQPEHRGFVNKKCDDSIGLKTIKPVDLTRTMGLLFVFNWDQMLSKYNHGLEWIFKGGNIN